MAQNYQAKQIDFDHLDLRAPMDIPLILSGNFGEMRGNHFHTGLDIKTKGVEGQKVFAIEEGYISRVRVSPWGYGNAIYIDHPNGLTSVYAHLSTFPTKVDSVVYAQQKKEESYTIDATVLGDSIYVKKGELIAYSGNSGSSYAPHLHFEVRETATEHALNPLLFTCYKKRIADKTPPRISGVKFYAITPKGYLIPGRSVYYSCSKKGDQWVINNNNPIDLSEIVTENSLLGIGFHTTDKLDAAHNVCGVHHTSLFKDDIKKHEQQIDHINFDHNRFLNSHQDYWAFKKEKKNIHKHFTTVVNPLGIYPMNDGKINWKECAGSYNFEAIDAHGNEVKLNFTIGAVGSQKKENPFNGPYRYLYPDSVNTYLKEDFQLLIEPASFYEPVQVTYRVDSTGKYLSPEYQFAEYSIPVQQKFDVRVKLPNTLPEDFPVYKMGIGLISDRGYLSFKGGDYVNGWIESSIRSFGTYTLVVDTVAPVIKPLDFNDGKTITKYRTLEMAIDDNLSGVWTFKSYLNGTWVLTEYNRRKKRYIIPLDKRSKPLLKKGSNTIRIVARDGKGNESDVSYTLVY
jgi:hypothetical protein